MEAEGAKRDFAEAVTAAAASKGSGGRGTTGRQVVKGKAVAVKRRSMLGIRGAVMVVQRGKVKVVVVCSSAHFGGSMQRDGIRFSCHSFAPLFAFKYCLASRHLSSLSHHAPLDTVVWVVASASYVFGTGSKQVVCNKPRPRPEEAFHRRWSPTQRVVDWFFRRRYSLQRGCLCHV